jgi:FKBP-type peptidyl-prolyl cis-trans isomerase FkpA
MRKIVMLAAALAMTGCNQEKGTKPQTDEQKAFYALGLSVGRNLQGFDMTPEELEYVKAGMTAQLTNQQPAVDLQTEGPKISELARTRATAKATKEKEKSKAFLEAQAKEPGAQRTESGLIYTSVTEGTGAQPSASDIVKVNYKGTLPDGKEFDSSYKRNEPAQFPLNGVIKCWTEGVQKMKVGGKAKLVCPSDLAYGDRGTPGIPGGSALVFEVELLDVQKNEPAPPMPMPGQPGGPQGAPQGAPQGQPAKPAPQGQPAKK